MSPEKHKKIIVAGAGFVGISCVLRLAKLLPQAEIVLINNKLYFEYYPALYRVVTGSSPLQACITLSDIFGHFSNVRIVEDTILRIDPAHKTVIGTEATYQGDYVVIGVGSENTYFNIEGVAEFSFSFKSIHLAINLKDRIDELFCKSKNVSPEEKLLNLRFVIVGGGPSGVELAGELVGYTKKLAKKYDIDRSFVTIDLFEASPRILAAMSPDVSRRAAERLRNLGVNVFTNRILVRNESWTVILKDMQIGARTVIWAAGVKNNKLFEQCLCFEYDGKSRVVVDEFLQAKGYQDFFVGGDNARTEYSGLAQTAIYDGKYIAQTIRNKIQEQALKKYVPHSVSFDIPIGPGWAILVLNKYIKIYGFFAWWMRHGIDLRFYLSILPITKALRAFFSGETQSNKVCS